MTTYEQSQLIDSWRDGILSGMQMRSVAKIYLERGRREVRSLLRRLPQWVRYRGDPLVGCVEDGDIVRFVSIQHERGDLHLRGVAQWPSDSTAVKPLDSELKGCLGLTGEELWVTALPLDRLFVRQMRIELTKERAIDLALPFQIESRLPFPLDEAVIDWLPVRREGRATEILVVAARKGEVEAHLERWRARGVDPHDVSLVPLGLVELLRRCIVQISEGALLAVGRGSAIVAVMQGGALVAARSIGRCDLAAIGHALLSIPLYRELERSPIFLIGGEREFGEEVARSLGRSVEPLSMEGLLVSGLSSHDLQSWALPIGVALAGGLSRRKKIDLRVGDLRVRRPWWRLRKKLALFAAYGVSAAVALNLLGGRLIARQERALCNDYCQLVRLVGDEEAPLPKTPLAIHNEVTRLERRLSGSTDLFPLAPNVPSASEFLAWLTLHPALGQGAAIRIDRVRYFLERYPTIKQPKERYQLRVELDFHAQNSTVARAFHDALLAPNDWVDPKIEVQWRSTASGYRTSFCLRDRTFYPGVDGRTGP